MSLLNRRRLRLSGNGAAAATPMETQPPRFTSNKKAAATASVGRFSTSVHPKSEFKNASVKRGSDIRGSAVRSSAYTNPRASGAYNAHRPVGFKDPRPLQDRQFQLAMSHKLFKYLAEHNYPNLSEKQLKQLGKHDFVRILEFIYHGLEDRWQCGGGRLEEVVPRLFKDLGYPITLKKSTLETISASHSWPHILAVLVWLVDLLQFGERLDLAQVFFGGDRDFDDDDDFQTPKQSIFTYIVGCYNARFLADETIDLSSLDKELEQMLCESEEYKMFISDFESKEKLLLEEHDELAEELEEDVKLEAEIKRMELDLEKMDRFIADSERYRDEQHKGIRLIKETRKAQEEEIVQLQQEKRNKVEFIAGQKLSVDAVRQMHLSKEEMERMIAELKSEHSDMQGELFQLEKAVGRASESARRRHEEWLQRLRLFVAKIQPSQEDDWLSRVPDSSPLDPRFLSDFFPAIKQNMTYLFNFCNNKIKEMEQGKLNLAEAVAQCAESLASAEDELEEICAKIQRLEAEAVKFQESKASQKQNLKDRILCVEEFVERKGDGEQVWLAEKRKELDGVTKEKARLKKQAEEEVERKTKALQKNLERALEFHGKVKGQVEDAKKQVDDTFQKYYSPDPL